MKKQGDTDFLAAGNGKNDFGLALFKKPFGEQRFAGYHLILHVLIFSQQADESEYQPLVTRARRAEGYRFVHVLPPFRWVWGRRIQLGQPPAQRLGILQKLRRAVILHKFQEGPGRALALGLGEKAEPVMLPCL